MNTQDFDLEDALRNQAAAIQPPVPRDLARTISAAITASVAEGPRSAADLSAPAFSRSVGGFAFATTVRQHWALWTGVSGAVAAAIVGAFVFRAPASTVDTHADAVALAQEVQGMPQRVLASLSESEGVAQEDPLHEEAAGLKDSAQSALGFLAYNFLPVTNG